MSKESSNIPHPGTLLRIVTVPISFKHLIKGQAKYFMEQGYRVVQVSADGPELRDVIAYEGAEHHIVPFTRQITLWQDLVCCWQLRRLIKTIKPTIVHTQTPKAGLLGMLTAWWCGVPLRIHTVGGMPLMETKGLKRQILRLTEKLTYRCAHKVLPNSKGLAQWMVQEKLIAAKRVQVLGSGSSNGIDTTYFSVDAVAESKAEIRERLQIPVQAFVYIFVGRLVREKGIVELVTAFCELANTHNHLVLLLVGPLEQELDPLPENILSLIKKHPRILATGYQSEVRPYYKAADLLVFPSYREGFPNVVLQAGAMGLPLLVTDINGCNEIVTEGINGWLIPSKDTVALKEKLLGILNNETSFRGFSEQAEQQIKIQFEQHLIWDELAMVYRQGK